MSRSIPQIGTELTKGYATLIGHNWDTVQESYNVTIPEPLEWYLEFHKKRAGEAESPVEVSFGGELFHIWIGGSQGKKWVIENDDLQIHFGSPKQQWPVTVRYLSGGLWEYGFDEMKQRVVAMLLREQLPIGDDGVWDSPDTWQRCSRADYAFDFYSPEFSREMQTRRLREKMVLPSGVKAGAIGTSLRDETITMGMNRAGLVIQVYDKGKEIDDMSGKTWMYKVWEREGYLPPEDKKGKDLWRVEIRFGKEFLKGRGILNFDQIQKGIRELLNEAIFSRRLIEQNSNVSREYWPLHPLWAATFHSFGVAGQYLPIGRQITLRRDAMINCLEKQIEGTTRSLASMNGKYDDKIAAHAIETCFENITKNKFHVEKSEKAAIRYKFLNEAR